MRRHRPLGDEQPGCDLLVAEALGNQLGDLDFPPGEGSGFAAMRRGGLVSSDSPSASRIAASRVKRLPASNSAPNFASPEAGSPTPWPAPGTGHAADDVGTGTGASFPAAPSSWAARRG